MKAADAIRAQRILEISNNRTPVTISEKDVYKRQAISIAIAASGTFCTVQYHAEVLETFLLINIF